MNERDYNRLLDRVEELEYRFNKLLDFVIRIDDHFGGIFGVTDQDSETMRMKAPNLLPGVAWAH